MHWILVVTFMERTVVVEWHTRLRSEQKFSGLEELVHQIQADKENAQAYFLDHDIDLHF